MSNADVLKSLKDGDLVKVTRTVKVDHWGGSIWGNDVKSGKSYLLDDSPTLKIEMVKKVAKQRTDYKVGDVVSGDELRATMWKRGTIVNNTRAYSRVGPAGYILLASGTWAWLDDLCQAQSHHEPNEFSDFTSSLGYVIKFLPD